MEQTVLFSIALPDLQRVIIDSVNACLDVREPQPKPQPNSYLSRKDVCTYLGISLPTLHKLMREDKIKAYHISGRTLFKKNEVEQVLQPVSYDLTRNYRNAGRKPKVNNQ